MELEKLLKIIYKVSKTTEMDVYVVGGFVRDNLLKIEDKKDLDFVVIGSGLGFAKKLDKELKEVGSLVEFPDFDTARYIIVESKKEKGESTSDERIELEFAGARTEKYDENSRKPKVVGTSLEEDLKRRDFTVNTLAQKIERGGKLGNIVDLFFGQEDLKRKLLRTPLDPDETFSEDPLRMMRAARFASQLGFAIEEKTYEAMYRNKDRLKIISAERIQEELFKMLGTNKPSVGLRILFDTGLLAKFLPEVCALHGVEEIFGHDHKENFEHTMKVIDNVAEHSDKVILRYTALMHDIGKPGTKKYERGRGWTFDMHEHLGRKIVRQIGKRLRMSTNYVEYVAKLVRWHQQPIALMDEIITDSAIRRLFVNLGEDFEDLLILCKSDITTGNPKKKEKRLKNYDYLENRVEEIIEKDKMRAFQSPFRGDEIMKECGLKPGPTVGKIKTALEEAILEGIIPNEYEATKKYFFEIKDKMMEDVEEWEKI
ncbi:MAG: HD domain-containing protein [Candidatus Magasanikiibacteriota bacterium]